MLHSSELRRPQTPLNRKIKKPKGTLSIHNYHRRVELDLKRIAGFEPTKRDKILEYYDFCLARGLSYGRIDRILKTLIQISDWTNGVSFKSVKKQDLIHILGRIEMNGYSDWTKYTSRVIIKAFFNWLDKDVSWMKNSRSKKRLFPSELLTRKEMIRMVRVADNIRDRAFIFTLYESGARIGEFLGIKVSDVLFDEYGAVLSVNGKTGSRRIRIVESSYFIWRYLNAYPHDENSYLWLKLKGRGRLSYGACNQVLKKWAQRAGVKKRVYPYLFRHSRATELADHLSIWQLMEFFGWRDPQTAMIYVHLSGKNIDEAILRIYGIK